MTRFVPGILLGMALLASSCSGDGSPAEQTATDDLKRKLESLGYVGTSDRLAARSGVTVHDRSRTHEGYNFYTSGHAPEAVLMDMEGRVIHRWARSFSDTFPGYRRFWRKDDPLAPLPDGARFWRHAQLLPDGSILAIFEGIGLVKLDRDSKVVWRRQNHAHHDLIVLPDGGIMTLTRQAHVVPSVNPKLPILEDYVSLLDSRGNEVAHHSVLRMFENSAPGLSWKELYERFWTGDDVRDRQDWPAWTRQDIFHTNSVEVIQNDWATVPEFKAGRVLTSFRNLDTVALLDLEAGRVVWSQTGPFREQHDPSLVGDGRIMVFDNFAEPHRSGVMIIDVATGQTLWEYRGTPSEALFTGGCGTSQLLPNGNVLITETEGGRALEITPDGRVVWEFHNPARWGARLDRVAHLFDVLRLDAGFPITWAAP